MKPMDDVISPGGGTCVSDSGMNSSISLVILLDVEHPFCQHLHVWSAASVKHIKGLTNGQGTVDDLDPLPEDDLKLILKALRHV